MTWILGSKDHGKRKTLSAAGYFLRFSVAFPGVGPLTFPGLKKKHLNMLYMFSTWRIIPFSKWLVK